MKQLAGNGWETQTLDRNDCNLLNPAELQPRIESIHPDIILNAVSWNTEEPAEEHPQALSVNRGLPAFLGGLVKGTTISLIDFSSDLVFNGRKEGPYTEEDKANPSPSAARAALPENRRSSIGRGQHLHHPHGLALRAGRTTIS
ncbi:MAG: sugar nucleotide-binding protein [Bilophila sp.]